MVCQFEQGSHETGSNPPPELIKKVPEEGKLLDTTSYCAPSTLRKQGNA
jgi:hypothetical protein